MIIIRRIVKNVIQLLLVNLVRSVSWNGDVARRIRDCILLEINCFDDLSRTHAPHGESSFSRDPCVCSTDGAFATGTANTSTSTFSTTTVSTSICIGCGPPAVESGISATTSLSLPWESSSFPTLPSSSALPHESNCARLLGTAPERVAVFPTGETCHAHHSS
jgi:hypothetical protein